MKNVTINNRSLKIAIVFPLLSSTGRSGGPASVAIGHAAELSRRGHDVTVLAVRDDGSQDPQTESTADIRTFPMRVVSRRLGFAGFYGAGMARYFAKHKREYDVVHVHMARDLVTLPIAYRSIISSIPTVVQPHGMIDRSDKRLAHILDTALTRRVLRRASLVLSLTEREDGDIRTLENRATIKRINNGVEVGTLPSFENRKYEVLFLARLQERKRPIQFVEMASVLTTEFPDLRFAIVGPDGGEAEHVKQLIHERNLQDVVTLEGAVAPSAVVTRMSSARVYVLPSVDEVFPMSMLEAFVSGTPTVATTSLGIAENCIHYGAAEIVAPDVEGLVNGVRRALNPVRAEELRHSAHVYLKSELDVARVVDSLEAYYQQALARN